jgi:hypothetical protein
MTFEDYVNSGIGRRSKTPSGPACAITASMLRWSRGIKKIGFTSATPDDLVQMRDAGPISDRLIGVLRGELS